jgi:hypothetical protein
VILRNLQSILKGYHVAHSHLSLVQWSIRPLCDSFKNQTNDPYLIATALKNIFMNAAQMFAFCYLFIIWILIDSSLEIYKLYNNSLIYKLLLYISLISLIWFFKNFKSIIAVSEYPEFEFRIKYKR